MEKEIKEWIYVLSMLRRMQIGMELYTWEPNHQSIIHIKYISFYLFLLTYYYPSSYPTCLSKARAYPLYFHLWLKDILSYITIIISEYIILF